MGRLQGKVALVTGAASGIGLATAERFVVEGAKVMLTDVAVAAGERETARLKAAGHDVHFRKQDVTVEAEWSTTMDAVIAAWGRIDVLVNNAGVGIIADVETETLAGWRKTIAVNLDAVFLGTQIGIKHMKASGGGSIINIASIEGFIGEPLIPAYNASKGGVRIFTKSAAAHCARAGYKIRINNVCPGFIETPMVGDIAKQVSAEVSEAFNAYLGIRIPVGHVGRAIDVANVNLFLASDESSYVTGADYVVDGGYLAR